MTAPRRVAYLLFQAHRRGSYLHDSEISVQAGHLRDQGIATDVYETLFDGDNQAENTRLTRLLGARLALEGYGLLVVSRLWDNEVVRTVCDAIRDAGGVPPPVLLQPNRAWDDDLGPFAFIGPGSAVETVAAIAAAPDLGALDGVPGLIWRDPMGGVVHNPGGPSHDENDVEHYTLRPHFGRIRVDPSIRTKSTHLVVYGNPGCPYRRSIREVDAWRTLDLDPEITNTKGCSFCNINLSQDYKFVHGIAEHVVAQIENIHRDVPDADLIILLDQDPFPYLPDVFTRAAQRGLRPFHLLIQARADLFVRRKEKFEAALDAARAAGHRCTPFLIGVENFHDPTLEFYNKGVTAETNVEVLRYLRTVQARYPDVFDRDHVSPGFIMWHPWVTFASLRVNVAAIAEHGFDEFRSEVALSKIRLYPDIPFYWRAKQEGLFLAEYADHGLDSARRYGYHEEAPYRFAHADAQVAYTTLAAVCRAYEPIEELKLLALVLDWVDAERGALDTLARLASDAPDVLVARFLAEHEARVISLQKRRRAGGRGVRDSDALPRIDEIFQPYAIGGAGVGGFVLQRIEAESGVAVAAFARAADAPVAFTIRIGPRADTPHFRHTRDFNVTYAAHVTDTDVAAALRGLLPEVLRRLMARERDRGEQRAGAHVESTS